jgi:hypothetical protein
MFTALAFHANRNTPQLIPPPKMNDKTDLLIGALCWLMTFGLITGIVAGALH